MPSRQRPPDHRSGDRHVLPRGCPEAPGGLLRIPQSHISTWSLCRRLLSRGGALVSNAEVIRFLLDSASPHIEEMRAEEAAREAERAAAVEREMADVVEEDNQEARWALGLLDEAIRFTKHASSIRPRDPRNDSDRDQDILGDSDSDNEDDIVDLDALREALQHSRYFTRDDRWEKSSDFLYQFFLDLPDDSFRQLTRMSRDSFYFILDMIGDHCVFHNNSPKQHAPIFV
ncbi:hypothetical protein R1sor_024674 [Riccia sorocarpa]|uniref:Uncharacterized protein n=1 Tax=Riccia sorocarpa TaxID=122646 RepID=A0ABD3GRC2_9MARC